MEPKTYQTRKVSPKSVKPLEGLYGEKAYLFPLTLANERDVATGKQALFVQAGAKKWYIICGEPVTVDYIAFCILKDGGYNPQQYEINGETDPLYENH